MIRTIVALLVSCALALMFSAAAVAHPHAWIDLSSALVFDAEGRATGISETWLFDEFYTAFAVQGRDRDGDGVPEPDQLGALLAINLGNLREYDYFTRATVDGRALELVTARDATSRMVGSRLEMTFFVPFSEPVVMAGHELSFAVYDPIYYIEILHTEIDVAVRMPGAPVTCHASLVPPNPEPQAVALAAALDRTQTAGDGLGALFAETVIIRCD